MAQKIIHRVAKFNQALAGQININIDMNRKPNSARAGFTLIELLIVIAIIAILASLLLPVIARAQRKALRTVDINNLRGYAQASFMYASDFGDWFPVVTLGSGNPQPGTVNVLSGIHYTRYLVQDPVGQNNVQPLMGIPAQYEPYDQNGGLLYGGGMIQNPLALFCPLLQAFQLTTAPYSTNNAAKEYGNGFMSSDDTPCVRSPYMFNPRLANPASTPKRKYNKTTDAHQLDVLIVDYVDASTAVSPDGTPNSTGVAFNVQNWAQWPSKGIESAFTDGSVKYANLNVIGPGGATWMQLVEQNLSGAESSQSYIGYDELFTVIQYSK